MGRQSTFSLPAARAEQLRLIAAHQGLSVGELLDQFIIAEWARFNLGTGGGGVPGFYVSWFRLDNTRLRLRNGVSFHMGDYSSICAFSPAHARSLAEGMASVADGGAGCEIVFGKDRIAVGRQGRGVVITMLYRRDLTKRGVTASIARDLSKALAAAADKADAE